MADKNLTDYAGGWITERKNTDIPTFLKCTYIVVGACTISYLIFYMYGETQHSTRGALVQEFVKATGTSPALMYFIAALATVFFLCVIAFAFRRTQHKDE